MDHFRLQYPDPYVVQIYGLIGNLNWHGLTTLYRDLYQHFGSRWPWDLVIMIWSRNPTLGNLLGYHTQEELEELISVLTFIKLRSL